MEITSQTILNHTAPFAETTNTHMMAKYEITSKSVHYKLLAHFVRQQNFFHGLSTGFADLTSRAGQNYGKAIQIMYVGIASPEFPAATKRSIVHEAMRNNGVGIVVFLR